MSRRSKRNAARPDRPLRLAVVAAVGVALAGVLGFQSLSSALTNLQPEMAVKLFPLNGLAMEQSAYDDFLGRIEGEADLVPSARQAADEARAAVLREPLTPRAYGVLALAETDPVRRDAIFAAATQLNRRDLFTQGLALDRFAQRRDFDASLATLDRLLRVHPDQARYFFSILNQALADRRALPAFADVLDGSSEWHAGFLKSAAANSAVLDNLVELRARLTLDDEEFDRRLIRSLAQAGDYATAYAIYQDASGRSIGSGAGEIAWVSSYAPFDWELADESSLRGSVAPDGEALEIFVRSGSGGVLAQRVIAADPAGFAITLEHTIGPPDQIRDVHLQLRCNASREPFFDERFVSGRNRFEVNGIPDGCDYMNLAIAGRAWSGRSQLRGTIGKLRVEALR